MKKTVSTILVKMECGIAAVTLFVLSRMIFSVFKKTRDAVFLPTADPSTSKGLQH